MDVLIQPSIQLLTEVARYKKISTLYSLLEISTDWLQLFFLLFLAIFFQNWLIFPILFVLIGARQYALLILLHDAQHSRLSRNRKVNDWLAIWLLAAPFGVFFSKSRLTHLAHHRHLGELHDPDYLLYCTGNPAPKDSAHKLWMHFIYRIFWGKLNSIFSHRTKNSKKTIFSSVKIIEALAIFICQSIIFFGFALFGFPAAYFFLWLLPLVIVANFLNDARIFAEHSNPVVKNGDKGLLISYISNSFERFFLAPHHMNYHAEHHLFPFIPHYYLPEIRKIIRAGSECVHHIEWRRGYLAHFSLYFKSLKVVKQLSEGL